MRRISSSSQISLSCWKNSVRKWLSALSLDGLDDNGADVVGVVPDGLLDLLDGHPFEPGHHAEVILEGPVDLGVQHPGPVELGEMLVLVGVLSVGHGEGVAAAAVKGVVEVDDLGPPPPLDGVPPAALALLEQLLDLPVHGDLEGVLHREGPVVDEENVVEPLGYGHIPEGLDELGHLVGVDVGTGHLVDGRPEDDLLEFRVVQFGVVHSEGGRGEEGVKVQPILAVDLVDHVGAFRLLHVDDDIEAVP